MNSDEYGADDATRKTSSSPEPSTIKGTSPQFLEEELRNEIDRVKERVEQLGEQQEHLSRTVTESGGLWGRMQQARLQIEQFNGNYGSVAGRLPAMEHKVSEVSEQLKQLATKDDLQWLRADVRSDIDRLRGDFRSEIDRLRGDDLQQLQKSFQSEIDRLRGDDLQQLQKSFQSEIDRLRGDDLQQLQKSFQSEIDRLRGDFRSEMDRLRGDDLQQLHSAFQSDMDHLRGVVATKADLAYLPSALQFWGGLIGFAAVAISALGLGYWSLQSQITGLQSQITHLNSRMDKTEERLRGVEVKQEQTLSKLDRLLEKVDGKGTK